VSCYAVKYCFVVKLSMLCMQEACQGGRRAVACRAAAQASTLVVGLVVPPPWRRWTEHTALAWWWRKMHAHGCLRRGVA